MLDRSRIGAYSESELDLVGFDPNILLAQIGPLPILVGRTLAKPEIRSYRTPEISDRA